MKQLTQIWIITGFIFSLFCQPLLAQSYDDINEKQIFKTWVTLKNSNSKIKGYMTGLTDSLIVLENRSMNGSQHIYFEDIKKIQIRKDKNITRGIRNGALSGFALGALIVISAGDNGFIDVPIFSVMVGTVFALPGSIVGAMLGSVRTSIYIDDYSTGQKEKLLMYRSNL